MGERDLGKRYIYSRTYFYIKIVYNVEFLGWLKSISEAPLSYQSTSSPMNASWCTACKTALRSHKVDLKKHAESNKHTNNISVLFKQHSIDNFGE